MVQKIIKHILMRRYFWRNVGFDELSELYISSMLRSLAVSMLMIFIPFYLYQQNYPVWQIFALFGCFFIGKAACDIVASFYVARFGPKHTMIVSCILQIMASALFLSVPAMNWPVWLLGPVYGAAASFFFIAYHVEFSKIKHTSHAGKEIGTMQIFEKVAAVLGPLIGGVVGTQFGSHYIFAVATAVLFASLWPLFRTQEPVQTRQQLSYRDLPLKRIKYDLVSYTTLGIENTLCINLWPFFIALFVLSSNVYAGLGILTSVAVAVSIISAHVVGRHIDKKNARQVLRISAIINAGLYLFRPFIGSPAGALAINVANEVITTGYRLPYVKGMYAAADDLPGYRIVYVASMECIASIAKGTVWFALMIVALMLSSTYIAMMVGFVIAGMASLLMMSERFRVLGTQRH